MNEHGGLSFDEASEHKLLRETARAFLQRELPPARIRELDQAREPVPAELWRRMGELGWHGMLIPERYGGSGGDALSYTILLEEIGCHWGSMASDFVLGPMLVNLLMRHGTEEQRETLLPGLASGQRIVAFSLSEPGGGTDLLALRTRASLEGQEWEIRGQKLYTSCAPQSTEICVLARTDEPTEGKRARGLSLIITPRQDAITVRKLNLMGMRSAGTSEVFYDAARAPETAILGERGRGFYHLIGSLNRERILAATISVGLAQAAFEHALRYSQERTAFGRPIGQFQAIQHYLADTAIEIAQTRLLVQKAAWLDSHDRPCSIDAAMAKVSGGELAIRATDRGMRILAGHGMTEDSPMERFLRDARLQPVSPLSGEMGRNTIAEMLGLPRSY